VRCASYFIELKSHSWIETACRPFQYAYIWILDRPADRKPMFYTLSRTPQCGGCVGHARF
jgi:hypothetical protein